MTDAFGNVSNVKGGQMWYSATPADITIAACRAHFRLKGLTVANLKQDARGINLHFGHSENAISEVINPQSSILNGQSSILNGQSIWYTLDGKKLKAQPTQPGIYINNGKKIIVNSPAPGSAVVHARPNQFNQCF